MKTESAIASCPNCGTPLPSPSPQGLCPRCLIAAALSDPGDAEIPPAPAAADAAWLAQNFPHLVIEEVLGFGGMGRVYKARQPHLNRIVALKVLAPARASDPEWLERFTREARALARLSHPHIVQVYDFGDSPVPHLLMEYVDGVNLRQAMANGALTAREALAIIPKLCDALHYAHERGVLHRDIKPENVLIDSEGRVKLVDFGLAKLRDDGDLSFTLTQAGAKLGTLAYMAPEQIEHPHEVDHRADIYSLGVVFYEMLTGELPLGRFPAPSEASGVDPCLDGVVLRTLEKSRDRRFQTADDLRSNLATAATASKSPAAAPGSHVQGNPSLSRLDLDYRSPCIWLGRPLIHVAFGIDPQTGRQRQARGIIAMGAQATGVLAIGVIARGIIACGILSFGLCSFGAMSVGLLFSYGAIGLGTFAVGNNVVGYTAAGVHAIGVHAASFAGAVDPRAAALGDFWLRSGSAPFLAVMAVVTSVLMGARAWAAWRQHRQSGGSALRTAGVYVLLGLMGSLFLVVQTMWDGRPRFAERLRQQTAKASAPIPRVSAKVARFNAIAAISQPLVAQASRTDSPSARDAAIREVIAAMADKDELRVLGGLSAAAYLGGIRFDKTKLREAARAHLASPNAEIRAAAVLAVIEADPEAEDSQRILSLVPNAERPEWGPLAAAVGVISKRDYTGPYCQPMLSLLNRGIDAAMRENYDSRDALGPLWGGTFSPELEARIVEWSYYQAGPAGVLNTAGVGYNTFYHALSTQANKSSAAVGRLVELFDNPDITNVVSRALWGLDGTVASPVDQAVVAAAVLRLLENRTDGQLWQKGLNLLDKYAQPQHLPAVQELADREALPADQRKHLLQIVQKLSQKQP